MSFLLPKASLVAEVVAVENTVLGGRWTPEGAPESAMYKGYLI